MDNMVSWYLMPLGGLLICLYVGFVMPDKMRKSEYFMGSSSAPIFYTVWLVLVRFVAPFIVVVIMCNKLGFITNQQFDSYFSSMLGSSKTQEPATP
jgi:NSS family neurotransmitter:Na+ symporter